VVIALEDPRLNAISFARSADPHSRPEFESGRRLIQIEGARFFWVLTRARWAAIPFSLLGASVCYLWARELYGVHAALLATTLWVFSPSVLAYGHLITPDIGAAALGAAAAYLFWKWLKSPTWLRAIVAGTVLGLAELTKTTWIILVVVWPLVWLVYRRNLRVPPATIWPEALRFATILLIAVWTVNLGYGFEGSFRRLGDFNFISQTLGGTAEHVREGQPFHNRFAGTWAQNIPVPVPQNYLAGIDFSKWEFERKYWSFLRGEWRLGGWWYYYLYAMLIKEPLGTWALLLLAIALTFGAARYSAPWRDELVLLLPAVAVLALVSSQTGYNHHLRYVVPAFPFIFIWISKVARSVALGNRAITATVCILLTWAVGSSLSAFPHSLSYFNELAGGPMGGHYYLGNSNVDWGQDLLYLKRWLDHHPEATPLHLAYDVPLIDPHIAGIEAEGVPSGPHSERAERDSLANLGPLPGWYAISVNKMHDRGRDFDYFLRFKPVGYAGYSIYIYDIKLDEANRVRRELGMPPLPIASYGGSGVQKPSG